MAERSGTRPGVAGDASNRREAAVWLWMLAAAAAASWLLWAVILRQPRPPVDADTAAAWGLVGGLWRTALGLLAVAAYGAARLARSRPARSAGAASPGLLLRLAAAAGLAALILTTVIAARHPAAPRALHEAAFAAALALGLAAALALATLRPASLAPPRRRWARWADALVFNAIAALLLAELTVALAARVSSSPLLHFDRVFAGAGGERAVRDRLRAFRLKPGTPFFDAAVNSRGYVDDEPFAAGRRDLVVAVLADSFGVGVVPQSYNFTSVAERTLTAALAPRFERIAVHNFGVASIGPPEYYYLLLNEALPTNPALVVLCLFVGNDLGSPLSRPEVSWLTLQSWRSFQLATRLAALRGAQSGGAVEFTDWGRFERGVPPWVADHRLERPSFGEERFRQIELERAGWCSLSWPELPAHYAAACRTLQDFHAVLRDRLLVVLVPDEFQVNDALWQSLLQRVPSPAALHRDHPQQQLVPCCERAGIQVLDLLPALRAAQRNAPTYHLRDTHWNAHGNRVAGEAIAAWILSAGVRPR